MYVCVRGSLCQFPNFTRHFEGYIYFFTELLHTRVVSTGLKNLKLVATSDHTVVT